MLIDITSVDLSAIEKIDD